MAMATSAADRRNRVDRRLARETRSARVQFAVAGALGLLTAAVVVAQAALLAKVIARAAVDHVPLSALGGSLLALAGVIAARALLAGGFEFSGRVGALGVMSELRGRLARRLLIERPGRSPDERTGELAAAAVQGVDSLESVLRRLPAVAGARHRRPDRRARVGGAARSRGGPDPRRNDPAS